MVAYPSIGVRTSAPVLGPDVNARDLRGTHRFIAVLPKLLNTELYCSDEVDHHLPEGIKGVGMLGHVGSSAAIANAIRWATGRRVRHLPVRLEDLL